MATKLIRLADGTMIEVEAKPNEPQQISSDQARRVEETIERIKPLLINACRPAVAAWNELSQEMLIEQAEIELGLGFEGEAGIPYLAKGSANANLTITLTIKPKPSEGHA
ncbi:CU044_2847 family protein [Candidatus Oscillochloris fontis]|uniref:CU044_2847 family protein n=1 Tax=Candidatus Oscillochloris fontis TaxID=2496868 RepID=UPI00101D2357|nr:CU044_2847 family protein [Candidatus Oscillochloris fontis]